MKLLTFGDSWTYGWDIDDPSIKSEKDFKTYDPRNDAYRIPKIWPTKLAKMMNVDIKNYSSGGASNDLIMHILLREIVELLNQGNKPEDLFVIVGWSSPERKMFWDATYEKPQNFDVRPYIEYFSNTHEKKFHAMYTKYFHCPEEYCSRFVNSSLLVQTFLDSLGIKWCQFNAFYHSANTHIKNWKNVCDFSLHLDEKHLAIWNMIDNKKFYNKNEKLQTCYSFIESKLPEDRRWSDSHPSEEAHTLWAEEMYNYIKENYELVN